MSAVSYGRADRLLHRLALGSRTIAELSFDIERSTQKPDGAAARDGAHVFIAGLARAGTTVLMRRFHGSGVFGSLTYRDMPFVLAPGLWSRVSRRSRRSGVRAERAHGDGLEVDVDSPESLDEVFWRIFCGEDYLRPHALVPHSPDAETLAAFRSFVAAVLQSREGQPARYLSKTNNSILRIGALKQAFPRALVIVPFRDPMQHANSLLRQHLHFSAEQRADSFVADYMSWLGHHEFGLDHRPFELNGKLAHDDPSGLDHWLELWCEVYTFLLDRHAGDVTFVSYDRLCTDPSSVWSALAERADLSGDTPSTTEALKLSLREVPGPASQELQARAEALHTALLKVAL